MIATASRSQIDLRGAAPPGGDWRHWAAEARTAAERADYRTAIHAAYWTAVARLEENHLLHEDRSRTPRESLRLIEAANAAYAPLSHLTRRFELNWYGYRVATSNDWADAIRNKGLALPPAIRLNGWGPRRHFSSCSSLAIAWSVGQQRPRSFPRRPWE